MVLAKALYDSMPVRKVVVLRRDKATGLFSQPTKAGPEYELEEAHRRLGFAKSHFYADKTCGDPRSFDPKGDYNCGGCNKADGDKCVFITPDSINRVAGSCKHWEDLFAGDPELLANNQTKVHANYGVRKGGGPGHVFGCHECPYASDAFTPDSQGRNMYCGKGSFRVDPMACCELNGAETV
jgi:hypothetical protein